MELSKLPFTLTPQNTAFDLGIAPYFPFARIVPADHMTSYILLLASHYGAYAVRAVYRRRLLHPAVAALSEAIPGWRWECRDSLPPNVRAVLGFAAEAEGGLAAWAHVPRARAHRCT